MMNKKILLFLLLLTTIVSSLFAGIPDGEKSGSITGIQPDKGHRTNVIGVTISGENTHFTQGTNVIRFRQGTVTINGWVSEVLDDNTLEAFVEFPYSANLGFYDVESENSLYDPPAPLISGFELIGTAGLLGISPDNGSAGQQYQINLTAYNTLFESCEYNTVYLFYNNETYAFTDINVISNTELSGTVTFPFAATEAYYHLSVINELDGNLIKYNAFYLESGSIYPQLNEIAPSSVVNEGTSNISISGSNTHFTFGENTVWISKDDVEREATQVSVNTDESITASINTTGLETGLWNVHVQNEFDGELILYSALTITESQGISENTNLSCTVFPNPASENITITLSNHHLDQQYLSIANQLGQQVKYFQLENRINIIDISDLNTGIYIINIWNGNQKVTQKLIVE